MTKKTKRKYENQDAVLQFWEYLSLVGAKSIGGVTDQYEKCKYYPAKRFHKLLVIKSHSNYLEWGSIDRLKNSYVWRYDKDFVETE